MSDVQSAKKSTEHLEQEIISLKKHKSAIEMQLVSQLQNNAMLHQQIRKKSRIDRELDSLMTAIEDGDSKGVAEIFKDIVYIVTKGDIDRSECVMESLRQMFFDQE